LEAVSRLLPEAGVHVWTPALSYALAQAVFDRGTRWSLIALEDPTLGLAGFTPEQLKVCSKALCRDIKFQTPQCDIAMQ